LAPTEADRKLAPPIIETARVVARESLSGDHCWLRLHSPAVAQRCSPGQFVHVACESEDSERRFGLRKNLCWQAGQTRGSDLPSLRILRRPFAVAGIGEGLGSGSQADTQHLAEHIELLIKVVGPGSAWLASRRPGSRVNMMGPLGRPFHVPADAELALLVGGGTGLASLLALARYLRSLGKAIVAVLGARSDAAFPLSLRQPARSGPARPGANGRPPQIEELEAIGARSFLVSEREDGLLVTQWVEKNLEQLVQDSARVVCYACGPWGMMQAMDHISRGRFPCQVSLEMRMACGLGVCRSCVVRVRGQGGRTLVRTVCSDGPVFDAQEVIWEQA